MIQTTLIPLFKVFMPKSIKKPLLNTLFSGYIGQGPKVEEFEKKWGDWIGNPYVLSLNSGTSALHLALHMVLDKPGDEVITTPMTCAATNTAIVNTKNARIVWADTDPITGLIDPADIRRKITRKTKAIIMVHLGGNTPDISKINHIAKKFNIKTIEDAAHGIGTKYQGKRLGNKTSDFVMYSFQAIKHINTIDGGALVCKLKKDYQRGKLLRWYGIDREIKSEDLRCEEDVKEAGYKFHMNDVCATIGIEMMKYIDNIIAKHRENAEYYNRHLKVNFVRQNQGCDSSYWLYTIHIKNGKRDDFMHYMIKNGVMASKVHARNDTHSMFKAYKTKLPGLDRFYSTMCNIPVGWWLTKKDKDYIVNLINKYHL